MATGKSIEAGRGHVTLGVDRGPLDKGLEAAKQSFQNWGASIAKFGGAMTGIGLSILSPFTMAINAASDAEETLNKFNAVFGDQAKAADEFASTLGSSIGRGVSEIRDGMAAFQAQFVGLGFGATQARSMAQEMASMAYDFGSFFNVSDPESFQRFISAMSGSGEVLDRFGINIKAAALDAEFAAMGLSKTTANATEQEKALARFNIIKRTLTQQGAMGDAEKTADSFANSWKRAKAQLNDLAIVIGQAILPEVAKLTSYIASAVQAVSGFARENQMLFKIIAGIGAGLVSGGVALLAFAAGMYAVSIAAGVLQSVIGVVGLIGSIPVLIAGMVVFAKVLFISSIVLAGIAAAAGVVMGVMALLGISFTDVGSAAGSAWSAISDFFGQFSSQASELVATVQQAFAGIWDAVAVGNFAMAIQIAMTGISVLWTQITNYMAIAGYDFYSKMVGYWEALKLIAATAMAGIVRSVGSGIAAAFSTVVGTINSVIDSLPAWARGGLARLNVDVAGGVEDIASGIEAAGARDPNALDARNAVAADLRVNAANEIAAGQNAIAELAHQAWVERVLVQMDTSTWTLPSNNQFDQNRGRGGGEANAIGTFSRYAAASFLATGETPAERAARESADHLEQLVRLIERLLAGGVVMA